MANWFEEQFKKATYEADYFSKRSNGNEREDNYATKSTNQAVSYNEKRIAGMTNVITNIANNNAFLNPAIISNAPNSTFDFNTYYQNENRQRKGLR